MKGVSMPVYLSRLRHDFLAHVLTWIRATSRSIALPRLLCGPALRPTEGPDGARPALAILSDLIFHLK